MPAAPIATPLTDPFLHGGLRGLLAALEAAGQPCLRVDAALQPRLQIAQHYLGHHARSPACSRSGDEPCVLYQGDGSPMPVLMGLYGSRARNGWLLHGSPDAAAQRLSRQLGARLPPVRVEHAPCHQLHRPEGLAALPVLSTTASDAGPYLTSGLVCALDPDTGQPNVSIHRMRVLDAQRLTIWMLPGRDLDRISQRSLAQGRPLSISINIGVPPAVYLTSALSAPFIAAGDSELALAGAVQGWPVALAACKTNDGLCLAASEIVIEAQITAETADEFAEPEQRWAMPEFLGYMGQGRAALPVVRLTGLWHRQGAIYQAFLGPGKEQSELLALPTEAGMIAQLQAAFAGELQVLDAHYPAAGGGQLLLVLQVRKLQPQPGLQQRLLAAVLERHRLCKAVWLVDGDVDIHSPEDLFWACTTRFQPSLDLHLRKGEAGFPLDPSQAPGYLAAEQPLTDKYLLDCTVPPTTGQRFARWTTFAQTP
jgi:gallate decarboxylase subunit C